MTIVRGSTHKLVQIPEVTFGTTPATPTMIETLLTQLQKKSTQTVLRSKQIRSHPYVDRMLYGRYVHDLSMDFELQAASHDPYLQVMFGSTISSKTMAFADALKSMTAESQTGGTLAHFDQYTGWFFTKLTVAASSSDTEPVKCTLTGIASAATLDATSTLATAVTAATPVDPFIFADATLTVAGTATSVMSGNFDINRVVDPLMLWASRSPREFIPGDVTSTGSLVIPYDTGVQAALVTAFSDNALVFKFANNGSTTFRQFTFPKCKLTDVGRPITTRAGIMQNISFEAYYDTGTTTICTLATE